MGIEITDCLLRCMEETSFFNDEKKLDTVYYLMQGLTYRQIAEKIDKRIPYVQRVMNFLRNNGLLYWGRWTPNVYRIGMEKSIAFLDYKERNLPNKSNFEYTTYANLVQAEVTKTLVVYTYLEKDREKIVGEKGEVVTPFYYTNTHFTIPFFKKSDTVKEFFDIMDSVDNDRNILMGTPSFEKKEVCRDPITVFICRYSEKLPELTSGVLTEYLKQDFKDCKVEVTYERVRSTLNKMKDEGVIFPKNALYFEPLSFQAALVRITTKEIYKIMGTFNKFNMLTRVALIRNKPEIFYLYVQYPFYQFSWVMRILDELDPDHKTYIETEFLFADTIPYQWSLRKTVELGTDGLHQELNSYNDESKESTIQRRKTKADEEKYRIH